MTLRNGVEGRMMLSGLVGIMCSVAAAQAADDIRVAVVQPQSGECAQWGVPITHGVEIWADEFNSAGGIADARGARHKIVVSGYDNNCYTAGNELAAVRRAVDDDGAQFILQTFTPASRKAVAAFVTEKKVLTTSYGAGYLNPEYPFLIGSVTGSPADYMYLVSYILESHPEIKNVAVLTIDTSFGQAALAYYHAGIEPYRDRVRIVYDRAYDATMTNDMIGLATPVAQSAPDLVVELGFTPGQQALFVEAMQQLGYKGLFGSESWTLRFLQERVPDDYLAGHFFSAYVVDASEPTFSPRVNAFYKTYLAKYGEKEWSPFASVAYAAMTTIEAGIKAADSPTGAAVQAKLLSSRTMDQPLFGMSTWGGKDVFGADLQLMTPLPVYNVAGDGKIVLEKTIDVSKWWDAHKAAALPVLQAAGQVSAR